MEAQILEINLISAQGLKPPSTNLRRLQTYAVAWVHPAAKLKTRVDSLGGESPTWNDKLLFRVSDEFISGDTYAVSVEIFGMGMLKISSLERSSSCLAWIPSDAVEQGSAGRRVGSNEPRRSKQSSDSTASTALEDWNCVREMAGNEKGPNQRDGLLCGFMMQRKIPFCPSDRDLEFFRREWLMIMVESSSGHLY